MIKQLVKRLGLDRVEDYLSAEMRRVKTEVLKEERKVVHSLLGRIEGRLAALGGRTRGGARGAGRRKRGGRRKAAVRVRKPGQALKDYVLKAVRKAGGPVDAADLGKRVKALGYKTIAAPKNLTVSIYKLLADKSLYHRVKAGVYELKRKATRRAAKRKAAPKAEPQKVASETGKE